MLLDLLYFSVKYFPPVVWQLLQSIYLRISVPLQCEIRDKIIGRQRSNFCA